MMHLLSQIFQAAVSSNATVNSIVVIYNIWYWHNELFSLITPINMWPNARMANIWLSVYNKSDSFVNSVVNYNESSNLTALEVVLPVIEESMQPECSIYLVNSHIFAHSYGTPYSGVADPKECSGNGYSKILLSFSASVTGRQFDRVGGIWASGVELLRFTTQEPSGNPITNWHFYRDVSRYSSLFSKELNIVVALDNIVNEIYTGKFNVTVKLNFYKAVRKKKRQNFINKNVNPADLILPLSASDKNYGWFTLPEVNNH